MNLWLISDLVDKLMEAISNFFGELINKFLIGLVGAIYSIVYYLYQIFLALAHVNVFDGDMFKNVTSKIYIILGIVCLFGLAYNLISYIIDPDKAKGGTETYKVIKNVVTSFIIIVLCPVIFKYAILIQDAVLTNDVIGKVFSSEKYTNNAPMSTQVASISKDFFRSFFSPMNGYGTDQTNLSTHGKGSYKGIEANCQSKGSCTLSAVDNYVAASGDFYMYKAFALNVHKDKISFNWFVSIATGIYVCYVILSFCFDMATRQIKLIFYQIIAPICIACRIIPGEDKVFKNWMSATFKTYMSVFVRMILMVISVLLINYLLKSNIFNETTDFCKNIICSPGVTFFAKIFLILACITFLKQGTKMICELFGFDDVKVSMKGKLKDGGAFMAGSALATGIGNASRKSASDFKQIDKNNTWKTNAGHIAKGIMHAGTGFAGGVVAGGKAGAGAESFQGAWQSANKTVDSMENKRKQKAIDKANGNTPIKKVGRWFTGDIENKNANSEIYNLAKGIKDKARSKIQKDADEGKNYTYGIGEMAGKYKINLGDGSTAEIEYSAKNFERMQKAFNAADKTVSYQIDPTKGNVAGNVVTLDKDSFGKMMNAYKESGLERRGFYEYEHENKKYIMDYSTEIIHKLDNLISAGKNTGQAQDFQGTKYTPEQLMDIKIQFMKSFEEVVASTACQPPAEFQAFIKQAVNDGRETISELNRDSLELRTLLTNNQTAEIVQAMRDMTTSLKGDEKAYNNYVTKGQFKYYGDELLSNLKKANEQVQNTVANSMYNLKVTNRGSSDTKK